MLRRLRPAPAEAGAQRLPARSRRQRGTTLLEALVAFLVLSLGMLGAARVQTQLRLQADVAHQRAEAVRLGQDDMEKLRAFSVMVATGGARAFADVASTIVTPAPIAGDPAPTRYTLTRAVDPDALAHAKATSVAIGWTDRGGTPQQIVLHSMIAESDPLYSGALALAPSGSPVKGAFGRSVRIPLAAKNLGNGSSVWKPVAAGTLALVFNNGSGLVTSRCSVDASAATRDLLASDLRACSTANGLLLSGTVRFASTSPPSASQVSGAPLPLAIDVALGAGAYPAPPSCTSEPIDAAGDHYIAYACVVAPLPNGQWSGRASLAPSGWSIGTAAGQRKVCRYSADLDASGAVDANAEHPTGYSGVDTALANQNFLVVGAADACPQASPARVEGRSGDVFANLSTVQHQP